MKRTFSGTCPIQGKEYSVSVDYIDASTNEGTEYTKGLGHCEFNMYGDKCDSNKCPILNKAPDTIR